MYAYLIAAALDKPAQALLMNINDPVGFHSCVRCTIKEQHKKNRINFEKTILQYDADNDDDLCRPTFNDIIKLNDVEISFSDELEDHGYDENIMNEQIENDVNDKISMIPVVNNRSHSNVVILFDNNHYHSNAISSQNTSEIINSKDLTVFERCIIEALATLSN
ncbi:unnamed protein product [Rotaria magnacalcarata]|uniref:Uncharacterized protein n=2 Tax=Rotaria magnacalcarata TaxID=392030 RepID=A0A814PNR9_9BILA|nr:unnamed protein product [Rotaria magnacalcarata]